ncbi:MAG: efflux RND transporter periplasmic adaptor subunit [Clostridiaceae bacterium]
MQINYPAAAGSKKIIIRIAAVFTVVILILTFLSKTIDSMLLPAVSCEKPQNGVLDKGITANGRLAAMDVEKLCAGGQWKIAEIPVARGNEVAAGDILAVVDSGSLAILNEKAELELTRLKNSLKNYVESYSLTDPKDNEEFVRAAWEALNEAMENEKTMTELYNNGAAAKAEADTAARKRRELQRAYEREAGKLSELKEQNSLKQNQYLRTVAEKQREIELKEKEIAGSAGAGCLKDGKYLSNINGIIKSIYIEEGDEISAGKLMFEIIPEDSRYAVCWELNEVRGRDAQAGDAVVLSFSEYFRGMLQGIVDTAEYVPEQKLYRLTSFIDKGKLQEIGRNSNEELKSGIKPGKFEGLEVEANIIKESKVYDIIIPSYAVQGTGAETYIFILGQRNGPLGGEYYADKAEVTVEDKDDFYSAVSSPSLNSEMDIIVSSTKPLLDGGRVKLR